MTSLLLISHHFVKSISTHFGSGSVAEWLACWTQAQKGPGSNRSRSRQAVHTHCASVHQAAKLVAALLRVAGLLQAWRKVMAAYSRVYDSRDHVICRLTAKNRDQLRNPTLGNRVCDTFTFLPVSGVPLLKLQRDRQVLII